MDAFQCILLPHEAATWNNHFKPTGALKEALLSDFSAPLPPYMTDTDAYIWKATLLKGGMAAPTCWYKVVTSGLQDEDDQREFAFQSSFDTDGADLCPIRAPEIPPERFFPPKEAPVFFGAALHDPLCLPAIGYEAMRDSGFKEHNVTVKDFDSDHWLILTKPEEVSEELDKWIQGTVFASA